MCRSTETDSKQPLSVINGYVGSAVELKNLILKTVVWVHLPDSSQTDPLSCTWKGCLECEA